MSIECGKFFTGGRLRDRRKRLQNHQRDRHGKFEVYANDLGPSLAPDTHTQTSQRHNVHRINIPQINTSTLRSEALQADLAKMNKRFVKDLLMITIIKSMIYLLYSHSLLKNRTSDEMSVCRERTKCTLFEICSVNVFTPLKISFDI